MFATKRRIVLGLLVAVAIVVFVWFIRRNEKVTFSKSCGEVHMDWLIIIQCA